jgi:hypothetical protein
LTLAMKKTSVRPSMEKNKLRLDWGADAGDGTLISRRSLLSSAG